MSATPEQLETLKINIANCEYATYQDLLSAYGDMVLETGASSSDVIILQSCWTQENPPETPAEKTPTVTEPSHSQDYDYYEESSSSEYYY